MVGKKQGDCSGICKVGLTASEGCELKYDVVFVQKNEQSVMASVRLLISSRSGCFEGVERGPGGNKAT